jgi:hypothetical protein
MRRLTSYRVVSLIAAGLFCTSAMMRADVIYNTFGPGNSYDNVAGYDIGGSPGVNQAYAIPFVPTETATVTGATLALALEGNTQMILSLASSTNGAPGSILNTFTQVGTPSQQPQLIDFSCTGCEVLTAGETYFLVATQSIGSNSAWFFANSGTETVYFNANGTAFGPWTAVEGNLPAFDVEGTPSISQVPEPSALLLMATGFGMLAVGIRLRAGR